jgi:nicotinate-nucleotide--dimethylbenzimidazole phosphoribosyltransferase
MTCRQYTCANCWNAAEGRCLTCAPHLGHEILPTPFPETAAFEPARIEAEAWPEVDLGAATAGGNGNGSHLPEGWGDGPDATIEEIDPAARLAFLSGEAPAPTRPAEPAWPAEADLHAPEPPVEDLPADVPGWAVARPAEQLSVEPEVAATEPVQAELEPVAPMAEPAIADAAMADASTPVPQAPAEPLPPTVEGRAAAGATRTSDLLRRFRPGESLDAELAAYEAQLERQEADVPVAAAEPEAAVEGEPEPVVVEAAAVEAEPEPVVVEAAAVEAEPEPLVAAAVVAPEPEPVALASEPVAEPEPIAAAPVAPAEAPAAPEPVAEPEPEPIAASAAPAESEPAPAAEPVREDRIEQPTWRIYAPEPGQAGQPGLPAAASPSLPAAAPPSNGGTPQWPVRPDQAESPAMALLANRGTSASAGLWAASAREVLGAPPAGRPGAVNAATTGVQPCSNCGLSLSATARFCRRCGTRQG